VYAVADRVGGFWEGQTFGANENGGYTIGGRRRLKALCLERDGVALLAQDAERVEMYPWQVRRHWGDGTVMTETVLEGRHGMIVTVQVPREAAFRITPVFEEAESCVVEMLRNDSRGLQVKLPGDHRAAVGVAQPGVWSEGSYVAKPVTELTVAVLFDVSAQHLAERLPQLLDQPQKYIGKRYDRVARLLLDSWFETDDEAYNQALHWAKISSNDLVVSEFGKGIWAGLSWFHQGWGRDTFISLPGTSLVTGQYDDAVEIIRSFATFQIKDPENPLYGRVPNRVCSPSDIIYNTTDGTPWLVREICEYVLMTGDRQFAEEMFPVVRCAIEGALKYYVDEKGFMIHADADTWMDAKREGREPWSARGNRAVDIQVLWHAELEAGAYLARLLGDREAAAAWQRLAHNLKQAFESEFYDAEHNALYDHLNADDTPDHQVRPNQMFAVSIPLFDEIIGKSVQAGVVRQVVSELGYPHGVASLSQHDERFHPYHHGQIYYFDAAYHNGLCWQWNAGPVISGMTRTGYTEKAYELTGNLANQILNEGMPGSLSELVEPFLRDDGTLQLSGTYSQAWSVAEFVRNFYQDYLGLRANLIEREVRLAPRLPAGMGTVRFAVKLGREEKLCGCVKQPAGGMELWLDGQSLREPIVLRLELLRADGRLVETQFELAPAQRRRLDVQMVDTCCAKLDGEAIELSSGEDSFPPPEKLEFQTPWINPALKALAEKDFLETIILEEYGRDSCE
jgi:glycogen debranching enzyme